ncbi:hypothetical protein H0Z60_02550 [Ectothiorhodospiraceae bacterium WFHF3C12]|nr:hypothetical protein [Ectothiorhodospiraceae bacterium WFHF3C12]
MTERNGNGDRSTASSGVETLIARLRDEGVDRGRKEAEELVADAQNRADWLLQQAREEADAIREQARRDAEKMRNSATEALETAARDTVLELHGALVARFRSQVRWLVATELNREAFLQQLILALASRVREQQNLDEAGSMEVVLPETAVGLEALRSDPESLEEGTLSYFVVAVAERMLRDGVSVTVAADQQEGLTLRLTDAGMEVELTADTVAEALLRHLQPRFRALLEGVLR